MGVEDCPELSQHGDRPVDGLRVELARAIHTGAEPGNPHPAVEATPIRTKDEESRRVRPAVDRRYRAGRSRLCVLRLAVAARVRRAVEP